MKTKKHTRGFSLIEVLISIFLVAVAVLGLAQLFLLAVANNLKADRVANATFLAQQQIDWLRGFTRDELDVYTSTSLESRDEIMDLNGDGVNDFRRITGISLANGVFHVNVHVYSTERIASLSATDLLANPELYRPRAMISTLIGR
ncbi:MAG: prepilin-type N-terminal cleavage/methylation domain-containing protein [Candidatus Aminicenantales bacterium]